ncbi:MAG: zf-HC2 domain-containing protein [Longimicrobiales bacterium]
MTCRQFFAAFSDYHDGTATEAEAAAVEAHLDACPACRQYERVVEEGVAVLRAEDDLEVPDDFQARLRHRILLAEEEEALLSDASSGATALSVLGIALILTAVVWSPLLRPGVPQVELSPLVVSTPPAPMRFRATMAFPDEPDAGRSLPSARSAGLFDDAHDLLFRYSRLSQRYRERTLVRQVGYDPDR